MYLRSAFVHMEVFMEGMVFPFCTRAEGNVHRFRRRTEKICPVTENKLPHYRNSCSTIEKGNGSRTAIRRRTASYGSPFCLSRYFLMYSSFDSPLATPLRHVRASIRLLRVLLGTFGLHFASWHSSRPRSDLLCLKGRTHSIRPSRPRGSLLSTLFSFVSYRHYERLSVLR